MEKMVMVPIKEYEAMVAELQQTRKRLSENSITISLVMHTLPFYSSGSYHEKSIHLDIKDNALPFAAKSDLEEYMSHMIFLRDSIEAMGKNLDEKKAAMQHVPNWIIKLFNWQTKPEK